MSLTYEEIEYCRVQVQYVPGKEVVEQKREQALEEIYRQSKDIALRGFRKGKAGLDVVKNQFKKQIEESTKQKLVAQALDDFVFESKAKTIFYPDIKIADLNQNTFNCQMVVLKKPDFELKQYKEFEIPRPHAARTQLEETEQQLHLLCKQHGDVEPYGENDFVQDGDKVTMDIRCVAESDPSKELTNQEGVLYEIGSHQFHEELDDNLLGMKAGDTRDFGLFVEGERAICTVLIHMGVRQIPCAVDDLLAQKVGFKTLVDLRVAIDGEVIKKIQSDQTHQIQQQLVQRLLLLHDFKVPGFLLDAESEKLAQQFGAKLSDLDNEARDKVRARAQDMVRLSLIMNQIREAEPEAAFSEKEIMEHLRARLVADGQDPDKFIVEAERSGRLYGIVASLQYEATIEFLVKTCKIID